MWYYNCCKQEEEIIMEIFKFNKKKIISFVQILGRYQFWISNDKFNEQHFNVNPTRIVNNPILLVVADDVLNWIFSNYYSSAVCFHHFFFKGMHWHTDSPLFQQSIYLNIQWCD